MRFRLCLLAVTALVASSALADEATQSGKVGITFKTGKLDNSTDVDRVTYALERDKWYAVAGEQDGGAITSYVLRVKAPSGTVLCTTSRSGGFTAPGCEFKAPTTGKYTVEAFTSSASMGEFSPVWWWARIMRDCPDRKDTLCTARIGTKLNGWIDWSRDNDRLKLAVTPGGRYALDHDQPDGFYETLFQILDANGRVLAEEDSFDVNPGTLTFTAPSFGGAWLRVIGQDDDGNTHPYSVLLRQP